MEKDNLPTLLRRGVALAGALAGVAVLLKVLHAYEPMLDPVSLLKDYWQLAMLCAFTGAILLRVIHRYLTRALMKRVHSSEARTFGIRLTLPFLLFALWIIKPFVNYQSGIFTSTSILAIASLLLIARQRLRRK